MQPFTGSAISERGGNTMKLGKWLLAIGLLLALLLAACATPTPAPTPSPMPTPIPSPTPLPPPSPTPPPPPTPTPVPEEVDYIVEGSLFNNLVVVDGRTDEIVKVIPLQGVRPKEVVPAPDKNTVYVVTDRGLNIEVVDLEKEQVVRRFTLSDESMKHYIYGLEISPDGTELYVHSLPREWKKTEIEVHPSQISVLDAATGEVKRSFEVPLGVFSLAISPDGQRLYGFGRDVYVLNPQTGETMDTIPVAHAENPTDILFAWAQYEQSGIFSAPYYALVDPETEDFTFGLFNLDLATGEVDWVELGHITGVRSELLFSAVVSPDRKQAYAMMNDLSVIDLEARKIIKLVPLNHTYYDVNISSDGKKLYLSGASNHIRVLDTQTFDLIKSIELPGDASVTYIRVIRRPEFQ